MKTVYLTSYKSFTLASDALQVYHKDVNIRLFVINYERLSLIVSGVHDMYNHILH